MVLSLIVPTYNERENVEPLVTRIDTALQEFPHEVYFVDDSTDGTGEVVAALARARPHVRLLQRSGTRGLASAVLDGLGRVEGEIICVLDADLQHPPETVPLLVETLDRAQADVVVASRYAVGGAYEGLSPLRRLASRVGTLMAQAALPRARLSSDPLSGFFVFRRSVVEGVTLRPLGFKILLEILVRGRLRRVAEVPYRFEARRAGRSKLSMRESWDYLRHLLRLVGAGRPPSHRDDPLAG